MNNTTAAYMAGILDGEGHFTMYYYPKYKRHMLTIGVMNTSPLLIEWLIDNFGGKVYDHAPKSHQPHWKQCWEWRLDREKTIELLSPVLPYMVIKKRHLELAIEFRKTFIRKHKGKFSLTDEIRNKRHSICEELKTLNRKGKKSNP